jgi:signal transduction histidine kinase
VQAAARPWSLRRRLMAVALASGALAWLAGGAAIYFVLQRQDAVLFDARLSDLAQTLLAFADHEIAEIVAEGGTPPVHYEIEGTAQGRYRYQIWSREGKLMLSSWNAPTDAPMAPLGRMGLVTQAVGGETMRIITLDAPSRQHRIQVAEPVAQRQDMKTIVGRHLGSTLLLSAALLVAWTLLLVRLALRPLEAATRQIAQRGPSDLSAVVPEKLPDEFAPLLAAINQLLQRVDVALRSEREFVAAAAHELRTPLAGLQAQAQLAAHQRTGPADRQRALQAVQDGVDHAAHLVGQLLDLARSDALAGDPARLLTDREPVPLREVLESLLAELGPAAAERGLRITPRFELPVLSGSPFGLRLILRNLLANAVAHAAPEGEVAVGTRLDDGQPVLWVADSGPGIPEAERTRLFERFYRAKGQTQPGSGLGLSIVKALAQAHGATISLGTATRPEAPLGGLLVELRFPAAAFGHPGSCPGAPAPTST